MDHLQARFGLDTITGDEDRLLPPSLLIQLQGAKLTPDPHQMSLDCTPAVHQPIHLG